jgi:NodT family efflux transporter outer membrane factor (OMF) lipoprotein
MKTIAQLLWWAVSCVAMAGCTVGPDYRRPSVPLSAGFKELDGWKVAAPAVAASATDWWSVYDDALLDRLERQIDVSNQTLKQAEAAWRQAAALVDESRAGLFPSLALGASGARARTPLSSIDSTAFADRTAATTTQLAATASGSWDLDVWGRIRRTVESDLANAQASDADLAAARLSAQAALAMDYIQLRVVDEQAQLLDQTVESYERSHKITQNQYQVGVAAKSDIITAETQLEDAQAQRIGLGVQRSQLEHAIAVLTGQPPADFNIAPAALGAKIPIAPADVPSTILERRPDIAEAERKVAAANAQIGVATAAYFPDLTLTGAYGFTHRAVAGLVSAPSAAWSVGGAATETVLDFGSRAAEVRRARAAYDAAVAAYRQTVLAAFQQVEDQLAALRTLEQQDAVQDRSVHSANDAVRLTLNEYKAGTVAFTSVVTVQAIALTDSQTLLNIRQSRLVASVALIQALGGGWSTASLAP